MELSVNRQMLERELALAQSALDAKTGAKAALSTFQFDARTPGVLKIAATNLDLTVRSKMPAAITSPGIALVPGARLFGYLKLLPEGEVRFKANPANYWMNIEAGRVRSRLAGLDPELFPEPATIPLPGVYLNLGLLVSLLGQVTFAIPTDESRFTLVAALVILKADSLTCVATDGYRLALAQRAVDLPHVEAGVEQKGRPFEGEKHLLLRRPMIRKIFELADGFRDRTLALAWNEGQIFAALPQQAGEAQRAIHCREASGTFPAYERILPTNLPHQVTVERKELLGSLERVGQFSDGQSRGIRLRFRSGALTVDSTLAETGESEEDLPIDYAGPEMTIGVNYGFLTDWLRVIVQDRVSLSFRDANSSFELTPEAGAPGTTLRYIVMPMRT